MLVRESTVHVSKRDSRIRAEVKPRDDEVGSEEVRDRLCRRDNSQVEAVLERGGEAVGVFGWAAGGVIPVLHLESGPHAVLVMRGPDAPSRPDTLSAASGVAETEVELLHPHRVSLREGVEEVVIATDDGWVFPIVPGHRSVINEAVDESVKGWMEADAGNRECVGPQPAPFPSRRSSTPAALQALGDDIVEVEVGSERRRCHGLLVFDFETNSIDVMNALEIDLQDVSVDGLRLFDGEVLGEKMLNRELFVFRVEELAQSAGNGPLTARRRYRGGKAWDGNEWVVPEAGRPVTVEAPLSPTAIESVAPIAKRFDGQS